MRFAQSEAVFTEAGKAKHPLGMSACLAFLAFLLLSPAPARAAADQPYPQELIRRAGEQNLAADPYWKTLLHYRPSWMGAERSLIDDPRFFLSPRGKTDLRAELAATLAAFFAPPPDGEEAAVCRFPARYAWLRERLGIDDSRLPQAACNELEEAREKVRPRRAVLIFPGSHVNSPASMFGHTLINIEGPYRSKLLSYAVNYSAATTETNGLAYAYRGVTGGYKGYYSVLPYYQKVREYNDLERRDMWEFDLNLSPEEVERLFLHVWELKEIYSDYFFFDENCSFNLLFLLEVARPSLRLTERARPWVIPIDTVRIVRDAGLIEAEHYRPSKARRIQGIVAEMGPAEKSEAAALLEGRLSPEEFSAGLSPEERRRILDLAVETIDFRFLRGEIVPEDYRPQYVALLAERSRLGRAEPRSEAAPPPPDAGHRSNRLALGGGWRRGEPFVEARLRPAYHHLLDADEGYLPGSQIEFLSAAVRWYPEDRRAELYSLDVISIVSLSPRHRFFRPVSWKLETGWLRKSFPEQDDRLVWRLNPGGGFAWQTGPALLYALFETDLQAGGRFRDSFALGVGGSAGALANLTDRWKAHLWGRRIWFELGDPHRTFSLHLDQNYRLGPNSALALELSRKEEFGRWTSEVRFGWNLFW